ncbi:hypothetical protein F2Q68_00020513 [Brassica cretica]|uniref:Uncharacterized protein n=1 Tax=Brassica cretica TaxID=69181 RepID=A0A8S9FVC1_BRACR|nr:hypothetical protein F2Q68_00020513 [Brassica cretica]
MNLRGISSNAKVYSQNSVGGYDDFEDQLDSPSSLAGPRSSTAGTLTLASSAIGADGFPRRFSDGVNSSNQAYNYGMGRATGRDDEHMDWRRKENFGQGNDHERPRALIDAYGVDTSKHTSISRPIRNVNGIHSKMVTPWQNTEEEEFDWEDMSPTLERSRAGEFLRSSVPALGSVRPRPRLGNIHDFQLDSDIKNGMNSRFGRGPAMISRVGPSGADALPDGTWPHLGVRGSNSLPVPSAHVHHLANPGNAMLNHLNGKPLYRPENQIYFLAQKNHCETLGSTATAVNPCTTTVRTSFIATAATPSWPLPQLHAPPLPQLLHPFYHNFFTAAAATPCTAMPLSLHPATATPCTTTATNLFTTTSIPLISHPLSPRNVEILEMEERLTFHPQDIVCKAIEYVDGALKAHQ